MDLAKYWTEQAGATAWGIADPINRNLEDPGAWWCLSATHPMTAMAQVCGLRLIRGHIVWNGDAQTLFPEAAQSPSAS